MPRSKGKEVFKTGMYLQVVGQINAKIYAVEPGVHISVFRMEDS